MVGKTVIVEFEEADYSRLLLHCQKQNMSVASYVENSTIEALNEEGTEDDTEKDS